VDGLCDANGNLVYPEAASYVVPEMGGCYFIRYPNQRRQHRQHVYSPTSVEKRPKETISMSLRVPSGNIASKMTPPSDESSIQNIENENSSIVRDHSSTSSMSSLSSEEHVDNISPRDGWSVKDAEGRST